MKKIVTTLATAMLLGITGTTTAQVTAPTWNAAVSFGTGSGIIEPLDMYGETALHYQVGYYHTNSVTIGSTALSLSGGTDAYLTRLSTTGVPAWAVRAAGTGSTNDMFTKVIAAGSDVYVIGTRAAAITFYSTDATTASLSGSGSFIAKYTNLGVIQWATTMAGTPEDIAVNTTAGRLYVSGENGSLGMVKSYDIATGTLQWTTQTTNVNGGFPHAYGYGIGANSNDANGNSYVVFQLVETINFPTSATTFTTFSAPSSTTNGGVLVTKLNSSGYCVWGRVYGTNVISGGSSFEVPKDLEVDASGNIVITGTYEVAATVFGSTTLSLSGGSDIFLASLANSNGNVQWAKKVAGTNNDAPLGLALDIAGNVLLAAQNTPSNSVTLNGCFTYSSTAAGADYKWYAAKFRGTNGDVEWSVAPTSTSASALPVGIGAFGSGNGTSSMIVSGINGGTMTFGSTVISNTDKLFAARATWQSITPVLTNTVVCQGGSVVLDPEAPSNASGITINWYDTPGGASIATGATFTTPPLSSSTTYYASSSLCPSVRMPVIVDVNPNPTVNAGSDILGCEGVCATIGVSSGNTGVLQWTYLVNGVTTVAGTNSQITVCPTGNGQTVYTLTGTFPLTGCTSQDQMTLTQRNNHPDFQLISQNTSNASYYTMELDPDDQTNYSINFAWKIEDLDAAHAYTVVPSTASGCWHTFNATQHSEKFPGFNPAGGYTSGTTTTITACSTPTVGQFLYGHEYRITRTTSNATCPVANSYSHNYNVVLFGRAGAGAGSPAATVSLSELNVYPNPGSGVFTVSTDATSTSVLEVMDMFGRSLLKTEMKEGRYSLDLSGYAKGVYLINVHNNGSTLMKKLIVE